MNDVNIALAQISTVSGNIEENTKKIIETIKKARQQDAHIIVFPELAVSGYGAQDLFLKQEFLHACQEAVNIISKECIGNMVVLLGFPEEDKRNVYSSVAILGREKVLAIHRKRVLPHFELYSENRYFKVGTTPSVININNLTIGITISEELFEEELIPECDIICCSGALPWSRDLSVEREQLFHHVTRLRKTPLVFVNDVGMADNILLEGNSCFISRNGNTLVRLELFKEDFTVISYRNVETLDNNPLPIKENYTENIYKGLSFGIKEFINKTDHKLAIAFLDQTLESRFNLALTAKALGSENVLAFQLTTKNDLPSELQDAQILADKLKVKLYRHSLNEDNIRQSLLSLTTQTPKGQHNYTWETNTFDRFRSASFLSFAELIHAVPLSHINKTQLALGLKSFAGSFTKSDFMPLLDLYHSKIIKLSEFLNTDEDLFTPEEIHEAYIATIKHPKIFSGKEIPIMEIDEILYRYIESNQSVKQIISLGFNEDMIISTIQILHETEGLRKQAGYGPKMSTRSFSNDWLFPAAAHWRTMNIKNI